MIDMFLAIIAVAILSYLFLSDICAIEFNSEIWKNSNDLVKVNTTRQNMLQATLAILAERQPTFEDSVMILGTPARSKIENDTKTSTYLVGLVKDCSWFNFPHSFEYMCIEHDQSGKYITHYVRREN